MTGADLENWPSRRAVRRNFGNVVQQRQAGSVVPAAGGNDPDIAVGKMYFQHCAKCRTYLGLKARSAFDPAAGKLSFPGQDYSQPDSQKNVILRMREGFGL
ncbi:hypothetical protein [Gluconobacter aidae]|uniref:hypothetical protein n=1 Tax=Gluconobacter aidae TaxID=2662454 RepID=UPI001E42FEFB|nr:hypothetical protein [Gluconobacter aidae]